MPTTTISIPADIGAQLDAVAQAQGSNSQEVALRASRAFLAAEDERRLTLEAIAELDGGQGMEAEQVREEMVALLERRGISTSSSTGFGRTGSRS
jgi:predicted transcriptional regulator